MPLRQRHNYVLSKLGQRATTQFSILSFVIFWCYKYLAPQIQMEWQYTYKYILLTLSNIIERSAKEKRFHIAYEICPHLDAIKMLLCNRLIWIIQSFFLFFPLLSYDTFHLLHICFHYFPPFGLVCDHIDSIENYTCTITMLFNWSEHVSVAFRCSYENFNWVQG